MILPAVSCGNGGNGREAFSPTSGIYEIMLKPGEWSVGEEFESVSDKLNLVHDVSATLFYIECYKKSALSDIGVSDVNGFIEHKQFIESLAEPVDRGEYKRDDLIDVAKKDMKGSAVRSGKRQTIYINSNIGEIIEEVVYFETGDYFFTMKYGTFADRFDAAQKGANEILAYLK